MKKLNFFALLLVILILGSCESGDNILIEENSVAENFQVKNKRLVFDSYEDVVKSINKLAGKSTEELDIWEESLGFTSLRRYKSLNKEEIPIEVSSIAMIINKNYEYKIENDIIFIHKGIEYIIKNEDEELLALVKQEITSGIQPEHENLEINKIFSEPVPPSNEDFTKYISAPYQYEFYGRPNGPRLKFVNELVIWYYGGYTMITLRAKFEWKKGRKWLPAGEIVNKMIRTIEIHEYVNLSGPSTPGIQISNAAVYANSRTNLAYSAATTSRCLNDLSISANFVSTVYPQYGITSTHSYNTGAEWYFSGTTFCRY